MLDFPLTCSKSEACKCWTVSECMKVTGDTEFNEFCKANYILDTDEEEEEEDDLANDASGYFSEDDLPADEMDEVDDDYFNAHLLDHLPVITPTKSVKAASQNNAVDDMDNGTPWHPNDDDVAPVNAGKSQEDKHQ